MTSCDVQRLSQLNAHLHKLLDIISRATIHCNNVGNDEYDVKKLHDVIETGQIFLIKGVKPSNDTKGLMMMQPSPFSRHIPPLVSNFSIVLDERDFTMATELYSKLTDFAVRFTEESAPPYVGVMTSLYEPCDAWNDVLEQKHFVNIMTYPSAGTYQNKERTNSHLYYREFKENIGKINVSTSSIFEKN